MAAKNSQPVVIVVEPDHDIAHLDQRLRRGVILADLIGRIMRRAINADRRGRVPVEEIRLGSIAGNPVLGVARQPKPQLLQAIEPTFLEPTVTALAQLNQAFGP